MDFLQDLIPNVDLLVFIIVAFIVLMSAIMVLEAKNLSHAIIFLAMTFAGIAIMYILMSAEFLAMIQMTVYTGGVVVLFLFALMLTRTKEFNLRSELNTRSSILVGLLLISLFVLIIVPLFSFYSSKINPLDEIFSPIISGFPHGIAWIGFSLFNYYQVGFIILGFLVVASLVGAIYIVKNEPGEDIRVVSPASLEED